MKTPLATRILTTSVLGLILLSSARADQPVTNVKTDGGIWLATITPDSKSFAGCTVITSGKVSVSSCDLPFSPVHSKTAIISWGAGTSDAKMLLPAVRDWGGPITVDSTSAHLLFSDFAGKRIQSGKGFLLPFISTVSVANPAAQQSQWGGIPTEDFGVLGYTGTTAPLPDGTLAGTFTMTLTDMNGKVLFQTSGTLVLRPML